VACRKRKPLAFINSYPSISLHGKRLFRIQEMRKELCLVSGKGMPLWGEGVSIEKGDLYQLGE
jgi:hypothetical protein